MGNEHCLKRPLLEECAVTAVLARVLRRRTCFRVKDIVGAVRALADDYPSPA